MKQTNPIKECNCYANINREYILAGYLVKLNQPKTIHLPDWGS